ncbi:hypothetical protein LP414_27620 [Polaromonas sp. P1(28)-13]|nr:hypothetical protein LP414_27620 [Polaromonas sp. P1(28)-13]
MEMFLTFFLMALMIVLPLGSYWLYCKVRDLHSKWLQWSQFRAMRKTLQRCTRQAYSRRNA